MLGGLVPEYDELLNDCLDADIRLHDWLEVRPLTFCVVFQINVLNKQQVQKKGTNEV